MLPLNTFTLDPDSLVPERTSAVSSVVSPLVSAPVTVPTSSVAALQEAVTVVSITNELILNVILLAEELVTVIVQSEYVPSLRELKVMVLSPGNAEVALEEHEPPYVIVPASLVENV